MATNHYVLEQIRNMNRDTHKVCPGCKGKGGKWVEDPKWRYASSGDNVRRWSECERCEGEAIIRKPETIANA